MTRSATSGHRNILTNATANWLGFAGQVVVAFFLTPVLTHALGDARYGLWSFVESIVAYLVLLDFGIGASVVRFVAKFEATQDQQQVNRVFSTSLCLFAVFGLAALVLAIATAIWVLPLFDRIQQYPELATESRWLLILMGLGLGFGLPLKIFSAVLDALGRYPAQVVVRLASLVVRTALLLVVAWSGGGLVPLGIVITACSLVEQACLGVLTWWYLPELRFSPRLIDRSTVRSIRGYSIDAFIAMMAGRLLFQTDAIVIGAFLFLDQITYFVMAARLVEYAKDSFRAITMGLMPAVSVLEAKGDHAGIRRVLFDGTRYTLWLVLPMQLGLMLMGKTFLALWLRNNPNIAERSYPVLLILATPLFLALPQLVASRILYGTGRLRWYSRAAMVEAVANLGLSIALVNWLGIEGVALGTAIPNVIGCGAIIFYICRYLEVRVVDYLRYAFFLPVLVAVPLALAWWLVVRTGVVQTWMSLLLTGAGGLATYLLIGALLEWGPRRICQFLASFKPRFVSVRVQPKEPVNVEKSEDSIVPVQDW